MIDYCPRAFNLLIIADMMEKTRPGGFCLVCSEIDLNAYDFGCDEPFGLCGTCIIIIFFYLFFLIYH